LRHADGRVTTVPVHAGETIGPGLLSGDESADESAPVHLSRFSPPEE
jgi:hypothetical protein